MIYQKTEIVDLSLWYGKEGLKGKKKEMEEEEKQTDSGIMKIPVMTEDELVNITNNMKNGKAAGVDGVRAELMKYIIKNDTIRTHVLKCCNNVLEEKIQVDWMRSNTTIIPKNRKSKILEHRPIAVTVLSSKLMCTYYREKIEEHLKD